MKKITLLSLLLLPCLLFAQIPSYYNDVNLNQTGISLKNELATKIISTHTKNLSYSQVWSSSKITDLDPSNNANVILVYGYNDNDGNHVTDRTRSKNLNGGGTSDWNREHTYAKSLGTPNLGTSGPGSDAHHLRPADVTFNGQRSSKKFATGSGHAGNSSGGWYPGDEWKGDIARMMMYMYLRYGNRCLPTNVGIGSSSSTPDAMISLFLDWNAQDPVSQFEANRNDYHGNSSNTYAQGNRNPFIDNPAFATQIWGGSQAEDLFTGGGGGSNCSGGTSSYPYNQGYENTIGDWTQSSADNLNWTVDANGTPSSGTGPSSASQGSYYIYVEASGNGTGYPNKRAIINSPCYDLSGASTATFSFKYHMYGSSDMGSITLEASTDGGSTWNSIWSQTGNKGNSWLTASINLSAYLGNSVQLRFNRLTGGTWKADVAIDNILLSTSGGGGGGNDCAASNLTLSITLDEYPEETAWTLKNSSGTTVASNSYSTSNPDNSTVTQSINGLSSGDYTFTITDAYGDGICCSYGNGSYTLSSSQGTIVTGGNFNSSEVTNFCIDSTKTSQISNNNNNNNDGISLLSDINIYPNPVNSILNIDSKEKIDDIMIFSALGELVMHMDNKRFIDVSKFTSGTYYIKIVSNNNIVTKKFIKK